MKRLLLLPLILLLGAAVATLALLVKRDNLTLLICILAFGAFASIVFVELLRDSLPPARLRWPSPRPAGEDGAPIEQFERLRAALAAAVWTEAHAYFSFRPVVREIVSSSLRRKHGVDLDRSPESAHAIVGDGPVWELARPDRLPPENPRTPGLSRGELERLLLDLEEL